MKNLMYFSGTVLCLTLSLVLGFHLGVRSAEGQSSTPFPFWSGNGLNFEVLSLFILKMSIVL